MLSLTIRLVGMFSVPKGEKMGKDILLMTRRELLAAATALTVVSLVPERMFAETGKDHMPYRRLGRTGEKVSIIGLGGAHIGNQVDEKESIKIIRAALDNGINFLDNCWDYNGGASEIRMGKALKDGYRSKAFLMTKIDGRDKKTAAAQIDESLRRLQTDHVDLMQFHEIIRMTDPERIFKAGGGIEALLAAKQAGKIRYIGFTGHKSPAMHLHMLEMARSYQVNFDTIQMPLNVMDAHYDSFEKKVLPVVLKQDMGVLGMKPMGDAFILETKTASPIECLHYAMSLPTSVVITGCDSMPILQQALSAARSYKPPNEDQIRTLLTRTAKAAQKGEYERYKISHHFDGTYKNPHWLGPQKGV
jgi:predicted aldo/keto reductase-like oxidoreductase